MNRFAQWLLKRNAYRVGILIGLLMTPLAVIYAGRAQEIPVIGKIENILDDAKFRIRGPVTPSGDLVVVAMDEKTISQLGRWPLNRGDMATTITKLTQLGAKVIVFDETFHDKVDSNVTIEKLRHDFADVALTSPHAAESLSALHAYASGHDVPALDVLDKIRDMQEKYASQLATAAEGVSGDDRLADAARHSPAVVLGAILQTSAEIGSISATELERSFHAVEHVRIPFPTVYPALLGDEILRDREPIFGAPWKKFSAAQAPFEALLTPLEKGGHRTQLGFFNTAEDTADGVIRRDPLVMAVGDPRKGLDKLLLVPSIDLAAIIKYYNALPETTRIWATSNDPNGVEYVAVLPDSAKPAWSTPMIKDFKRIPVDKRGQLLINYYGPRSIVFDPVSLSDVVADHVPPERVRGKICLLGATAYATFDQRVTPFDSFAPGVFTHASAIENMLHEQYLIRPWWAGGVEVAVLLLIAFLVGRLLIAIPVIWGLPVMIATGVGYYAIDYWLFLKGFAIFSAVPILEVASIYTGQTIYRYRTEESAKKNIRRAFQFYLNASVIEEMLKDPSKLKLGGEKRVLSVMFSDIRGFTTISEKLSPEELAKLINEYLTPMTNLVFEHGGTLDKYIGDALMAIWGAPLELPDHALRACRTAVAMMSQLGKLQDAWKAEGRNYPPIDIGIGINSGPMVVGNMGADQRFDYTVLGDNVNLASRLEGTNKDYRSHIIISQNTYAMVEGQVAALDLGAVRVKGKKEPVRIYELLDDKPATGDTAELIALFNEMVALFRNQQWAACKEKCNAVLAKWPHYGPPHAYLDFCAEYEATPPGADWDGVYTMTHK